MWLLFVPFLSAVPVSATKEGGQVSFSFRDEETETEECGPRGRRETQDSSHMPIHSTPKFTGEQCQKKVAFPLCAKDKPFSLVQSCEKAGACCHRR